MTAHPDELVLNDYADGSLVPDERADVEEHLAVCATCRALVDDLGRLKTAASALGDITPPERVWQRVRAAAAPSYRPAAVEPGWWALAAAAAVLAAAVWIGARFEPRADVPSRAGTAASTDTVEAELREAEQHYASAIEALQQITSSESATLDAATMATLQKNLTLIDQAIGESRAALRAQPGNDLAQASLFDGLTAKITLLHEAVALIAELRKDKG